VLAKRQKKPPLGSQSNEHVPRKYKVSNHSGSLERYKVGIHVEPLEDKQKLAIM
jgi:hypothetical protein